MTTYNFADVAGGTVSFSASDDVLVFGPAVAAATLRFAASGSDLLVYADGSVLRLTNISLGGAGIQPNNLVFQDGSVLYPDSSTGRLRIGTDAGDWFGVDRGGADTVVGAGGDDYIEGGNAVDADDSLDGGDGTADLLVVGGDFTAILGAQTVTGIETIRVGDGIANLVLDDATVATASPAEGALFCVDASGQGLGSSIGVSALGVSSAGVALLAGAGDDSLVGGFLGDSLRGGSGDDTISAGWGDDTIEGGAGVDRLTGGTGSDLFVFDSIDASQSPPATPDLITDFEGAGVAGGDLILLPGAMVLWRVIAFHVNAADFVFEGYEDSGLQIDPSLVGDGYIDVLWRAVDGQDWRFEVWADLNDNGRFDAGDVFIRVAVPGGDSTTTLLPTDFATEFGGLLGDESADVLVGLGATDDVMWGEGGDDSLFGNDGVDVLVGGAGNDTLLGGDLADELHGDAGSDWLDGGAGFDTLYASDPYEPESESPDDRNMLIGGERPDALFGGIGFDTLLGGEGEDLLYADEGDDSLSGGSEDDIAYGGGGADTIDGDEGDDTILGGAGGDLMAGGAGADLFVVDLSTAGLDESTGAAPDWILDFTIAEGDLISLALIGGLVAGVVGTAPLVWRGAAGSRDIGGGPGFGLALPGEGVGPGYYQAFWIPGTANGAAAGGWFVVDLDQDLILDADDAVIRLGVAGSVVDLTPDAFVEGTFRTLVGTAAGDTLLAAASGQEIFGLAGDDRLAGRAGGDRLVGGDGADTLLGNGGADQLWGGAGNDWLDGGDQDDEMFVEGPAIDDVDGFFARNTVIGGNGDDSLWGSDGRDSLDGGTGNDRLYGGVGNDTLAGGTGADTITGGDGADLVVGGAGGDSIDAGSGDDTVDYDPTDPFADGGDDFDLLVLTGFAVITLDSSIDQVAGGGITRGFEGIDASAVPAAVTLTGSSGRNRLIGSAFNDAIAGRDGNDTLEGGSGADMLDGGAGDDFLRPGLGGDTVAGGDGRDTISYSEAPAGITLVLFNGQVAGMAAGDRVSGVEVVIGSEGKDTLGGSLADDWLIGGAGTDSIAGFAGNDTLSGGTGANTLRGGPGDDYLIGGIHSDVLDAGAGNDVLIAGGGLDKLFGGSGNDRFELNGTGQIVAEIAGGGEDTVWSSASWVMRPNVEWLFIVPGSGGRYGVGSAGDDHIMGNEAANLLVGQNGNDTIHGGGGNDPIQGRVGDDSLMGEDGNDIIYGGDGADVIDGGVGRDVISGDAGADTLYGGDDGSTDVLRGGSGADWLDGGAGYDVMAGGLDNDIYIVSQSNDAITELAGQGVDRAIARFAGGSYTLPVNVEELTLDGPSAGIGNTLSNLLAGGDAAESLFGRAGNDTLVGGGGNDVLFGEAGRDSFLFAPGSKIDVVADFTPGEDRIMLKGFGLADFDQMMASARQGVNGVILDLAAGDAVQLAGVAKTSLHADDFVFLA